MKPPEQQHGGFVIVAEGFKRFKMKAIDKRLDDIWRKLVKLKAGNKCEIETCQKTTNLNSHHVYSRVMKSVR